MAEVVHYVSFFAKKDAGVAAGGRFCIYTDNELKAVLVRGPVTEGSCA